MPANSMGAESPRGPADIFPSDDESWAIIGTPNSYSRSDSSVVFVPSPSSVSLASHGVIVLSSSEHRGPSPSLRSNSLSPAQLQVAPTSSPAVTPSVSSPHLFPASSHPQHILYHMQFDDMASSSPDASNLLGNSPFMQADPGALLGSPDLLFEQMQGLMPPFSFSNATPDLLSSFTMLWEQAQQAQQAQEQAQQHAQLQAQMYQQINLDIPPHMQSLVDVPPWNPMGVPDQQDTQIFPMDDLTTAPSPLGAFTPANLSSSQEASPRSRDVGKASPSSSNISQKRDSVPRASLFNQFQAQGFFTGQQPILPQSSSAGPSSNTSKVSSAATSSSRPIASKHSVGSINKVRGTGSRIEKRKAASASSSAEKHHANSGSGSSSSDDKFFIVTPTTISSHAGSGNRMFECLEAMSTTQKGRKGPLAEEVKEGALQVRRVGACFCCHARKVRCDAERPCKNCRKLISALPLVVCWRFDDFLTNLFPGKIRHHLGKNEMAAFYRSNILSFDVPKAPTNPVTVRLFAGMAFQNTLEIRGVRFFNPATVEVLQHERLLVHGNNAFRQVFLAAPIALDMSNTSLISASQQQERVRRALRTYVESIMKEEPYVNQLGASINHTDIPWKILFIIRCYCMQTNSPIVKQALAIYTMHYMMAQHLCIAKESVLEFKSTGLMPQDDDFLTSRMLGRQIKAILDEMMQEEVDKLFKMFSRELKPKSRASWAPCLAAFLVFCLFMEAIGLVIDRFVSTKNEEKLQNAQAPKNSGYSRQEAKELSRAIENMPFRQFAFQFHNVYQTHQTANTVSTSAGSPSSSLSSASSASSANKPAFNPLIDDSILLSGDLDPSAVELVTRLRELLTGESLEHLRTLSWTPILDAIDPYPYPRDVAFDYNGRLCSKFLLSFFDKNKIFTP